MNTDTLLHVTVLNQQTSLTLAHQN